MTDSNTFLISEGKKEAASYFLSDFPKRRKQKVSCVSLGYTSGSCWGDSTEGWRLSSVAGRGHSPSSCKNPLRIKVVSAAHCLETVCVCVIFRPLPCETKKGALAHHSVK